MFFHDKRLQYVAQPDKPDPVYAKKLQEVLGGQWGEIAVSLQYLFQGWACRGAMPNSFPQSLEHRDVSYQFWNCSSGVESQEGRWARGAASDGRGTFEYVEDPQPLGPEPDLGTVDPRTWGTPPAPMKASARKAS